MQLARTNVVRSSIIVVPSDESPESTKVVKLFVAIGFGQSASDDVAPASWFVSELARLFRPGVAEAAEQQTAGSKPTGNENAGSRIKEVAVPTRRAGNGMPEGTEVEVPVRATLIDVRVALRQFAEKVARVLSEFWKQRRLGSRNN
jgi:hypothetical protein